MTRDPESIMPALHQEARDSERLELPADRDRPSRAVYEPDDPPLAPTPEQRKLIRDAFEYMATVQRVREGRGALARMTDLHSAAPALVTGTLPADHDKLTPPRFALSRAAHTPPIHTCHAQCPCHTGGTPAGDFIGDEPCRECSYWDDAYRDAVGVER